MHILIANISHVYVTQILIFECDFNEMSKILVILIILSSRVFIFNTQFSFVVKTIKVTSGRKVQHTLYMYTAPYRRREVYPIILNAGRTRSRHTCPGSTISRSRRF